MLRISGRARSVPEASVTLLSDCHSQPVLSRDRQTRTMVQKVSCHAYCQCIHLNSLRFYSVSRQPCSLAVALHARYHGLSALKFIHSEIFECADLKFTVSGRFKRA